MVVDDRLWQPLADAVDALLLQRSQAVDAQASSDGDQESGYGLDLGPVGRVPAQVGILQKVLGFGARAEHAIGDPEQTGPVQFEECGGGGHGRSRGVSVAPQSHYGAATRSSDLGMGPYLGTGEAA